MALDQNDLTQISALLGQGIAKAVQDATAPLLQKIASLEATQASAPKPLSLEDVRTVVGDSLKAVPTREEINAELAKLNTAKGEGEPKGQGADAGKPPVDVTSSPEFKALQERFEASERASAAEREQAAQEARRRLLRDTIAKNGFQGRQEHAARFLEAERAPDGKPLLRLDDKGNLCWAKEHLGAVRLTPLEDGVKEWAGSDDAKTYLPPKGAEGTGDGIGGNGGGQGKKTIPLAQLGRAIGGQLLGQS